MTVEADKDVGITLVWQPLTLRPKLVALFYDCIQETLVIQCSAGEDHIFLKGNAGITVAALLETQDTIRDCVHESNTLVVLAVVLSSSLWCLPTLENF